MKTGLNNRLCWAEHTVYRLYDQEGRLIYVGCTHDLYKRLKFHQKHQWWYPQIARIVTETHPSRSAALNAETRIRDTEHPRWNIEGRWMKRGNWNNQMFSDYITAMERHYTNRNTAPWKAKIEKAKREQARRYGNRQQAA